MCRTRFKNSGLLGKMEIMVLKEPKVMMVYKGIKDIKKSGDIGKEGMIDHIVLNGSNVDKG